MKCLLARLTVRLVSAILFVAQYYNLIEDYFVDIETHGLFNKIRLEQDGNEYEYRLEVPGGLLVLYAIPGVKEYYKKRSSIA